MSQIRRTSSAGPVSAVVHDFSAYRSRQASGPAAADSADKAAVSDSARELNRARPIVEAAPDMRPERINELRSDIEQGNYQPDPKVIAKVILSRGL
jgi:flagellar biosynthesis anti-sigma factor FlgM